jgi:hypothetical protein
MEVTMDISGVTGSVDSARMMGDLLKEITSRSMGLEKKMMEVTVAEKVTDRGQNFDILA